MTNLFPFDEGETVADYRNATTLMLADVLNDNRVTRLKKVLAVYNHQAQDSAGGQMDLFTGEVKSKEDILNTVKTLLENGTEEEQQSAVNAAVEQRKAASVQQDGVDGNGDTGDRAEGARKSLKDVIKTLYTSGKGVASKLFSMNFFDVAETPKFMRELGLSGDKFTVRYGVIARHFGKDKEHTFPQEIWEHLPEALLNPFAITKYYEDANKQKQKGYRLYTTLQLSNGSYVVVSADVKNAGRNIEVNAINTIFGRSTLSDIHDELIYMSETITPEQQSLLNGNNPHQYTAERELSGNKGKQNSATDQEKGEKNTSIAIAEAETDKNPTDGQKEAGNYKKGHVRIDGFDISIENPKGSERKGTDASGKPWSVTMNNTYGYIRRTEGVDGDHIDVFLSDDLDGWNGTVYVVDQVNTDGSFDEHKVMYGFNSEEEARAAYLSNYSEGWQGLGAITGVTKDEFKKWVDSSHRKTKAFAEYKSVKAVEGNERNGEKLHKRSGVSDKNAAGSSAEVALRDALVDRQRESGIDVVTDIEEGQRVLDEANSKVQMQAKKRALETASLESDSRSLTVVPSADGAKVLKNLETTIHFFENSSTQPKTFIGDVAKALGAKRYNSRSEYATFETKNGRIVTIRLADHNAKVSNFDRRGELDGISIVVSPKRNAGIINDGDAHIVEYYYDAIRLRRAKSKPLADIVRSIQQALYSGEFTDTTGLGVRQEVNRNEETVREQRGYTQRDNGDNVSVNALAAEREGSFGKGLFSKHYGLGQGVFDVLRKLGVIVGDGWHHTGKNFKQTDYFAWHDSKRVGGDADYSDGSEPDGIYARYRENKKEVNAAVRRMLDKAPAFKKEVKRESFDAWASHVMPFSEDAYLTEQDKAERKKEHDRISGDISIPPRYRRESHNVVDQLYFNMAYENWKKATEPLRSDYDTYVKDVELKNEEIMKSNLETDGMEKEMMSVLELLGINDAYGVVMRDRMSDARIVRYFRTASGEAYGFVKGGKIYIDPRIAKSDTPIHEYAHLWAEALRQRNAEEWRNVVELMKGTSVWEEVKSSYPELKTDDEIADEAIAQYSGKRGAERLRKAQEEVLKGDGDVMEKAAAVSALERVKEALGLFWKGVADFLHIHYNSAEDVADRVLKDLLDGVNPEVEARKDRQLDRINETNPMLDDYHTGIRSANDIRTLREAIQDAREEANGDWDELSAYPDVDNSVYENALESGKITVYSSKPITDGNFVTPSRMQAEEYAGGGKVYSKTVSIDDVAWITTDEGQMAAIGKDNVSEYPMRMQFVGENGAANMDNAESKDLEVINERFNKELTRYQTGDISKNEMLHIGSPQGVMRMFLPDIPIVMRQRILKKGSVKKHNIDVGALMDMPKHLSEPIFVFKRSDNVLGILTEMQDRDGKNVCVAIELNRQIKNGGDILEVNDVRSVHGRNIADIVYPIVQNGTLEWVDKNKGLDYLSSASRYVQQEIDKQDLDSAAKLIKEFENPKFEEGKVVDEDKKMSSTNSRMSDEKESPDELTRAGIGLQSDEDVSMANDPWAKMWGKSFRTKEQKRAFAEHARKNIERHIKELVGKLHLDNVEIVADASELTGKRAQAKGFYNKKTGKITIVLSNHSNIADIEQTLLHEAVAHYGLRQLFGKNQTTRQPLYIRLYTYCLEKEHRCCNFASANQREGLGRSIWLGSGGNSSLACLTP